jgi:orotidine-5'-phosphate decarboxylase
VSNHFGDRIFSSVKSKKTPLIVGLDPVYNRLPAQIRTHQDMNDEFDVAAAVDAIFDFCTRTLRVVAPLVPAVKINIAFFERYLWEGLEAYYSLITEADELGIEVIGDVKRGDIGSTAELYARAHLANPDVAGLEDIIAPDAITINGYAGSESILPFANIANSEGKGVFVWVRSSNQSAALIQDTVDVNGTPLYERMAAVVAEIANEPEHIGTIGYSNVGMIVGGTTAQATASLRVKYPKVWFLVPGFGTQGATAADCMKFVKSDGGGALINSSRSIIYAYESPKYTDRFGDNWEKCIEQAVIDAKVELAQVK